MRRFASISTLLSRKFSSISVRKMKLGYTIIYVKSVPETLSFYQSAFGIPTRFCVPSDDYGELQLSGTTTLAFAAETFVEDGVGKVFEKNRAENKLSAGAEISFVVDEKEGETVDSAVKRAKEAGAVVVQEPAWKAHGQTVAYVKDCNGFLVEICTPMGQT